MLPARVATPRQEARAQSIGSASQGCGRLRSCGVVNVKMLENAGSREGGEEKIGVNGVLGRR
jgi:hypothetical protein